MRSELTLVRQVALPSRSALASAFESVNLADAFSIQLPPDASKDPDVLARFIFSVQPSWIGALIHLRDAIVASLGLKTAKHLATLSRDPKANRISIFKVFGASDTEVVLGERQASRLQGVDTLCASVVANGRNPTDSLNRRPLPQPLGPSLPVGHCSLSSPGGEGQSASCCKRWVAQGRCVGEALRCPMMSLELTPLMPSMPVPAATFAGGCHEA